MKLAHLRAVTAVAERGSLRAAGRHLGVDQPSITRAIREVEHELGVALFERHSRGVVLTAMGHAFLRRANAMLNELRLATEEIAQLRGRSTGHVNALLSSAVQMALLPGVIAPFRQRFPDVHVTIREAIYPTAEAQLLEGSADFYVGPLPGAPVSSELLVEKLFDNTRLVFGRKGHPKASARSLRDLAQEGWIRTMVTTEQSAELAQLFEQYGLPPPRIEIAAASTIAIILIAANSDLLTMLPKQWMEFVATQELLAPIYIAEPLPAPPICVVTRAKLPLTPAAEFLTDLFRRVSGAHAQSTLA